MNQLKKKKNIYSRLPSYFTFLIHTLHGKTTILFVRQTKSLITTAESF